MLPRSRIVSCCLLLTFFYQQVEVDGPHSSNYPLPAVDAFITEDNKSQIHLNRQRRDVNQQAEYNIDVEVSFNKISLNILQMNLANLTYPIILMIGNGNINITNITPTTSCRLVNNETQCTCIGEFKWNSTFCRKYQPCSANTTSIQTCDCIRGYPTEGVFCDVSPIRMTPAPTTRATTTTTIPPTPTTTKPPTTTTTKPPTTTTTKPPTTTTTKPPTTTTTKPPTTTTTKPPTTTTTKPPTTTTTIPPTTIITTPPTTTPSGQQNVKLAIVITELSFTDELKNSSSELYRNRSTEFSELVLVISGTDMCSLRFCHECVQFEPHLRPCFTLNISLVMAERVMLNQAYKTLPDAMVKVLGFTEGSLVVLYQVTYVPTGGPDSIGSVQGQVQERLSETYGLVSFLAEDKIPCYDFDYGTTSFGSTAQIPCMGKAGYMRRICGLNGSYGEVLNFCLNPKISELLELTFIEVAANFSSLLQELSDVSGEEDITEPGNVEAVVTILTKFSETNISVDETDLTNFLQIVSAVISMDSVNTWSVLNNTNNTNPSSLLLQSVETFTSRLNLTNSTIEINQTNLQLTAIKLVRSENHPSINVTFENFNITGYLSATILISGDEFKADEDNVVVILVYPTWIDILRNSTVFDGSFQINGLVMTITFNRNRPITINMMFSPRNSELDFDTAKCAFWDFAGEGAWNDSGCNTSHDGDIINCSCKHLTSFSILMSPSSKDSKALEVITQIGIAISLASLLITIIIEAVVWKQVTKNKTSHTRHVAILNIAINLLIADVWFIVASSVEPKTGACVAATFFIHFFYLALFFWMLALGLLLVYRLVFIFHDFSKSTMMGISFSVGYLCPLIISVITIGATHPRHGYIRDDACWLGWRDKYPILAFVIPALTIIASNVVVLFVVIFKLLRPTIGNRHRGQSEERETFKQIVRSIVVLTPILGLTWGFGIPTFQENSHIAFDYIFTILNAFQGFFILIFGTCMDSKVREALLKKFSLSRLSSRTRSVQTSSAGRFRSKAGIVIPGRKKSYNVSGQVASGSKDKFQSYSTLQ